MSKEARRKLDEMLRDLKLPGVGSCHAEAASRAEKESWGFERFLHHVLDVELELGDVGIDLSAASRNGSDGE